MRPTKSNDISRVRAVLTLLEAGLRLMPAHRPEHPIHEQRMAKVRVGFAGLWERLGGLQLTVTVHGLQWEADLVLPVDAEREGLAWALSEAGIRFIAFSPGVEEEEFGRFLAAIHRARSLTPEDVDDLLTLLWTADFQRIRWKSSEVEPARSAAKEEVRPQAEEPGPAAALTGQARPGVIMSALDSGENVVIIEALRIIAEKGMTGLNERLEGLADHDEVRIRSAVVPVLLRVPTAQDLRVLVSLLRDSDPDIRIAAVQGLSTHAYTGALQEIEAVVHSRNGELDLTERRAFFEAYGSIAGEAAVPTLKTLLLGGSLGRGRGDSDTRACATLALGHVGTRSARLILQKVIEDRDVVVRAAAARALRQEVA